MGSVALGTLYLDQGRLDEAERLIKPVADSGDAGARQAPRRDPPGPARRPMKVTPVPQRHPPSEA